MSLPTITILRQAHGELDMRVTNAGAMLTVIAGPTPDKQGIDLDVAIALNFQADRDGTLAVLTTMLSSLIRVVCTDKDVQLAPDELYESIGKHMYTGKIYRHETHTPGDE